MSKGILEVAYGPMFAGKTTYLIKRIGEWKAKGEKVSVVKPRIDDRYGQEAKLYSHNGSSSHVDLMIGLDEIVGVVPRAKAEGVKWLVVDEAMFFPAKIIKVVQDAVDSGINVLAAGLDLDYKGQSFGAMKELISMAAATKVLCARCAVCGEMATMTKRSIGGRQQIVGASDIYQPVCVMHHTVPLEINYPYLRKRRGRKGCFRIEVAADSMRVGKTTAIKVLAEGLVDLGYSVTESYEDWQHNPYLKESYADPEKNFLDSQKWFVRRKWEQVRNGAKSGIFLQDVSPEMDYCYAATNHKLGRMSESNFVEYDRYFRSLDWAQASAPDLLIYLQVSDSELIKRAIKSRREFETVDENYFLTMKQVNREWLSGVNDQYTILNIDTDKIDFANEEMGKEKLIQKVVESISI